MRLLSLRLIGLIAAIACMLVAGNTARASCGDYLSHNPAMPAAPSSSEQQKQTPTPRPCNGPNCSGHEQLPLLPVAPAPVERDRPAALTTLLIELPSPQFRDLTLESSLSLANPVLSDIFHPPR